MVPGTHVGLKMRAEGAGGVEVGQAEGLLPEDAEEALHLIEPRGAGGRVVEAAGREDRLPRDRERAGFASATWIDVVRVRTARVRKIRHERGRRREPKRGGTGYPMGSQRRRPSRISAKAENMVAKNTEGVCDLRHGSA